MELNGSHRAEATGEGETCHDLCPQGGGLWQDGVEPMVSGDVQNWVLGSAVDVGRGDPAQGRDCGKMRARCCAAVGLFRICPEPIRCGFEFGDATLVTILFAASGNIEEGAVAAVIRQEAAMGEVECLNAGRAFEYGQDARIAQGLLDRPFLRIARA
jgi:hypothetical protein